jgi:predicted Fe-Mo cluster-binding NifX family protein
MKIAVTVDGDNADAAVSAGFAESPFFALLDAKTLECRFVRNEGNGEPGKIAGLKAIKQLHQEPVSLILTGEMKPAIHSTCQQMGIRVYMNITGTLKEILKELK